MRPFDHQRLSNMAYIRPLARLLRRWGPVVWGRVVTMHSVRSIRDRRVGMKRRARHAGTITLRANQPRLIPPTNAVLIFHRLCQNFIVTELSFSQSALWPVRKEIGARSFVSLLR